MRQRGTIAPLFFDFRRTAAPHGGATTRPFMPATPSLAPSTARRPLHEPPAAIAAPSRADRRAGRHVRPFLLSARAMRRAERLTAHAHPVHCRATISTLQAQELSRETV